MIRLMRGGSGAPMLWLRGADASDTWRDYMSALAQSFAASGPTFGGMEGSYATSGKDQVFDKHYYRFTLCVYAQSKSGTISMDAYQRRWWTWKKYGYWVTSRGYFRWWSHTDNSYDFDAQTRFWNGSGLKHDHYTNCLPSNYNCWY